jgi:hypothetical protein
MPTGPTRPTSRTRALVPIKRALVYTHRWLGIAGSLLFVTWFLSGIVMMYARMPRLTPEDRLMRVAPLDLSLARVDPSAVLNGLPRHAERLRVGMLDGRPVYRAYDGAHWTTVFADSGQALPPLDAEAAVRQAVAFAPEHASTIRYDTRIEEPDQWTLQIRALLPAHRVALGTGDEAYLYISEQSAEPILETTRTSRRWGYLGAIVHWIYFTPIRRNGAAWTQLIIWTSIAGSFLCLTGIVWGIWRFSFASRYRLRGVPHTHTPYAGMMRWHHYSGLVFGLVTFTWVFSGLLSMDPWDWSPSTSATREQREAVAGGAPSFGALTLSSLTAAASVLGRTMAVKEIEVIEFRGELVAEAYRVPERSQSMRSHLGDPGDVVSPRIALEHQLVSLASPERGAFTRFDDSAVEVAARTAMPDAPVTDLQWLSGYDAYYYDRQAALPLPVLRIKFADPVTTWLYLDPRRGVIMLKEERLSRLNRWLYHGLHSLDLPWLYDRRPLWDAVVIALSLGGLAVSTASAPAAWRRLRRHARNI